MWSKLCNIGLAKSRLPPLGIGQPFVLPMLQTFASRLWVVWGVSVVYAWDQLKPSGPATLILGCPTTPRNECASDQLDRFTELGVSCETSQRPHKVVPSAKMSLHIGGSSGLPSAAEWVRLRPVGQRGRRPRIEASCRQKHWRPLWVGQFRCRFGAHTAITPPTVRDVVIEVLGVSRAPDSRERVHAPSSS